MKTSESMFERPELAAELRKIAHDANLRNRDTRLNANMCIRGCGNVLTVEDYRTCRQCVLQDRLAQL